MTPLKYFTLTKSSELAKSVEEINIKSIDHNNTNLGCNISLKDVLSKIGVECDSKLSVEKWTSKTNEEIKLEEKNTFEVDGITTEAGEGDYYLKMVEMEMYPFEVKTGERRSIIRATGRILRGVFGKDFLSRQILDSSFATLGIDFGISTFSLKELELKMDQLTTNSYYPDPKKYYRIVNKRFPKRKLVLNGASHYDGVREWLTNTVQINKDQCHLISVKKDLDIKDCDLWRFLPYGKHGIHTIYNHTFDVSKFLRFPEADGLLAFRGEIDRHVTLFDKEEDKRAITYIGRCTIAPDFKYFQIENLGGNQIRIFSGFEKLSFSEENGRVVWDNRSTASHDKQVWLLIEEFK